MNEKSEERGILKKNEESSLSDMTRHEFMRYTQNVYLVRNYRGIRMNYLKYFIMADDLTSTTLVETAEILFAENLHATSTSDFNEEISFMHSEGFSV